MRSSASDGVVREESELPMPQSRRICLKERKACEASSQPRSERGNERRRAEKTYLRAINFGAFSRSRIEFGPGVPPAFLTFATIDLYSDSLATKQGWLQSLRRY